MTTEIWIQKCKDYIVVETFREKMSDAKAERIWAFIMKLFEEDEEW